MQTFARFALVFSLAGPIALIDAQAFEKKLKREIEEKKNTPEKKERKLPSKRPPRRSIRPEGLGTLETNAEKAEKTEAETKSDLTNEPEKRPSLIPDAKPIAEKLFTLQAVEFLTVDLAAENRSFPELKAALAYHRVVYDKLRRQAGDTDDEACREAIAFYDKRLKSIESLTNEFYTSICRDNEAIRKQIDQTQRTALLNGLMFGLDRSANGASDADSFVTGMAAAAVTIENESPKIAKARKRAQESQAQTIKSFREDFDQEAKGASDDFSKLANSPDWKSAPFLLRQPKPEENPFAVFKTINKIGDATSKELITHATTVAQAAKRVPLPEAFHPFRVLFLAQAGRLANRAASLELGTTALPKPSSKPIPGGLLAQEIWDQYLVNQKVETQIGDDVLRQMALAQAYAGKPGLGVKLITDRACDEKNRLSGRFVSYEPRPTFSSDPKFWYDCARISGAMGNPKFAIKCLLLAGKYGFSDKEAALVCEDLQETLAIAENRKSFDAMFRRPTRFPSRDDD